MKYVEPKNEQELYAQIKTGMRNASKDVVWSIVFSFLGIYLHFITGLPVFSIGSLFIVSFGIYSLYIYNSLYKVLDDYETFRKTILEIEEVLKKIYGEENQN